MREKKGKKIYVIVIIIIIVILLVVLGVSFFKNYKSELLNKCPEEPAINLEAKKIDNIKAYDGKLSEFYIAFTGLYEYVVTYKDINNSNVTIYEFDANIKTSWEVKRDHYVGVKLTDVLKFKGINSYVAMQFIGAGRISVEYLKNEIEEGDVYLVVSRNFESINNAKVSLLGIKYNYIYSIEDLTQIKVR